MTQEVLAFLKALLSGSAPAPAPSPTPPPAMNLPPAQTDPLALALELQRRRVQPRTPEQGGEFGQGLEALRRLRQ